MWRICFPFDNNDGPLAVMKKICIDIPVVRESLRELGRPYPEPWVTLGEKAVKVAQDLPILASIARLASDLSPEFGRTVQAGIEQAAQSMQKKLPKGVELHFREQTAE